MVAYDIIGNEPVVLRKLCTIYTESQHIVHRNRSDKREIWAFHGFGLTKLCTKSI